MLKCWNVAMLGKCVGDNEPHSSRVHLSKHLIPFSRYLNQYYHPDDLCPYVASRNLIQFSVSFSMLASCVSPFNSRSIPFTNIDRPTDRTKTKQWRHFSFQQTFSQCCRLIRKKNSSSTMGFFHRLYHRAAISAAHNSDNCNLLSRIEMKMERIQNVKNVYCTLRNSFNKANIVRHE